MQCRVPSGEYDENFDHLLQHGDHVDVVNAKRHITVQAVVKANSQCNGNGQISTPGAPKPLNGFR